MSNRLCGTAALAALLLAWPVAGASNAQTVPIQFVGWKQTTPFKGERTGHQVVAHNRRLYVLGGYYYNPSPEVVYKLYDDVQSAAVNDKGEIERDGWKPLNSFSGARSGHACVCHHGVLYLLAGSDKDGKYLADVQFAAFNEDGTIGEWKTAGARLQRPRSNAAAAVYTNAAGQAYLVVVGGVGEVRTKTVHFDDVEVAPIGKDGTVGPWTQAAYHFRGGRSAPGAAAGWAHLVRCDSL